MKDAEFRSLSETEFLSVEDILDTYDWDFDYENNGDILTVYDHGQECMIMTKNFAHYEIWLVVGKEAYHFTYRNQDWISTRNEEQELSTVIRDYLDIISGACNNN